MKERRKKKVLSSGEEVEGEREKKVAYFPHITDGLKIIFFPGYHNIRKELRK